VNVGSACLSAGRRVSVCAARGASGCDDSAAQPAIVVISKKPAKPFMDIIMLHLHRLGFLKNSEAVFLNHFLSDDNTFGNCDRCFIACDYRVDKDTSRGYQLSDRRRSRTCRKAADCSLGSPSRRCF
jgi:hypothetical protein